MRKKLETDLGATLESLRTYRKSDPDFERTIADWVDAEASLKQDPAEGHPEKAGRPERKD